MKLEAISFKNSDSCAGLSYSTDAPLDLAKIEINGRYPENGWARNLESHEMVYVLSGEGSLLLKDSSSVEFLEGEVVHIPAKQWFAWEDNMTILMACSPAFNSNQYETKEMI